MINHAGSAFGDADGHHFFDNFFDGGGRGLNGAGAGDTAEGAEACEHAAGFFTWEEGIRGLEGEDLAVADDDVAFLSEIEGDDRNFFEVDVLPDIEFGPIREREDADGFAFIDAGVVEVPEFGALVFWVPLAELIAEGEDAFFGAGFFFFAACAAEGGVELVSAEGVEERLSFEHSDALLAINWMREFAGECVFVDDEFGADFFGDTVAEGVHFREFVAGVNMHEWEGELAWIEGLLGEAEHADGVFADGEEHDGALEFCDDFAEDVNALGFELFEVRERILFHGGEVMICRRD